MSHYVEPMGGLATRHGAAWRRCCAGSTVPTQPEGDRRWQTAKRRGPLGIEICSRAWQRRRQRRRFSPKSASINGRADCHNANRSPHGPPRPEHRRQGAHSPRSCAGCSPCPYHRRVASRRHNKPERYRRGTRRASRSDAGGQPTLAPGTSLAAVEAAGGVARPAPSRLDALKANPRTFPVRVDEFYSGGGQNACNRRHGPSVRLDFVIFEFANGQSCYAGLGR
jgi:hypothetical protein